MTAKDKLNFSVVKTSMDLKISNINVEIANFCMSFYVSSQHMVNSFIELKITLYIN